MNNINLLKTIFIKSFLWHNQGKISSNISHCKMNVLFKNWTSGNPQNVWADVIFWLKYENTKALLTVTWLNSQHMELKRRRTYEAALQANPRSLKNIYTYIYSCVTHKIDRHYITALMFKIVVNLEITSLVLATQMQLL